MAASNYLRSGKMTRQMSSPLPVAVKTPYLADISVSSNNSSTDTSASGVQTLTLVRKILYFFLKITSRLKSFIEIIKFYNHLQITKMKNLVLV